MTTDDNAVDSGDPPPEGAVPAKRGAGPWLALALVAVVAVQLVLLVITLRTGSEVTELREDVEALSAVAAPLAAEDVPSLGSDSGAASEAPSNPEQSQTGGLPRFLGGGADPALGRSLGELAAVEYYSGSRTTVDPADGVARAYVVWAHWCPYCQDELPMLADWHEANASDLEGFELVSVTTAMDETAGNPLIPYLEANAFPFPVLVDEDGSLAQQLGVNAFPFWVFTAPDGTVVGRAAGFIGAGDLADIFDQLVSLETTAMEAPAGG